MPPGLPDVEDWNGEAAVTEPPGDTDTVDYCERLWDKKACYHALMSPLQGQLHTGITRIRFNELRVSAEARVQHDDDLNGASDQLRHVHARFFRTLTHHSFSKECGKFFQDHSGTCLQRIKRRRDGFTFLVPFTTMQEQLECLQAYHSGLHQRNSDLAHKYSSQYHWPSARAWVRRAYGEIVSGCAECRRVDQLPNWLRYRSQLWL